MTQNVPPATESPTKAPAQRQDTLRCFGYPSQSGLATAMPCLTLLMRISTVLWVLVVI